MSEEKHAETSAARQLRPVALTSEQLERLYLESRTAAGKNPFVGKVGNATPIGITSFLLSLLPLSMDLMGFQGASSASGITLLGGFYGVGGIGLYIASIMEWILCNTFPSVVFAAFGGFWISYAVMLQPSFGMAASFATPDQATNSATAIAAGSATTAYNSGFALYFLTWGLVVFLFFITSLKTNVAFAGLFFFLTIAFELLAAGYFHIGHGISSQGDNELKAAGACGFVVSMFGIWIDVSLLLAAVDFPIQVSTIDLSGWGGKKSPEDKV